MPVLAFGGGSAEHDGMPEVIIPVVLLCLFVGLPLAIVGVMVALWLRRSRHEAAFKTFLGCVVSACVSFLSFTSGLALLISLALRDRRMPGYVDNHPMLVVVLVALGMLSLLAAFAGTLFGLWTVWRVIRAPAANPAGASTQQPPPVPSQGGAVAR